MLRKGTERSSHADRARTRRWGGCSAATGFRRCSPEELPENDCPPVRVKLLSERLIAFRDTEGRYGLMDEFCAHRGISLWFGRNEECGLRCPYHGWKYDVTGQCVDMPNEPEHSAFAKEGEAEVVSARRARRRAVDLHGTARDAAAAAGIRVRHGARRADLHVEALPGVQLAAGDGRRHRFEPRLVPASRRPQYRSAVQGRARQSIQPRRPASRVRGRRKRRRPLHRRAAQRGERPLLLAHHAVGDAVVHDDPAARQSFGPRPLLDPD